MKLTTILSGIVLSSVCSLNSCVIDSNFPKVSIGYCPHIESDKKQCYDCHDVEKINNPYGFTSLKTISK